jgi:beta-glucuronidase
LTDRKLSSRLRCGVPALVLMLALMPITAARASTLAAGGVPADSAPPTRGALSTDGPTDRYLLGGAWLYRADVADVGLAQRWWEAGASTHGWSPVSIPNAYNAGDYTAASDNGYVGWYRRDFTLPRGAFAPSVPMASQRWIIRFESVNYRATVWLNGQLVGRHAGTELPFEFELRGLRLHGVNHLVVRIDNRRGQLDLPPGVGGWWNYGGILREVYLRAVAGVDIADAQVTPLLPCPTCSATVNEQVQVRNLTRSRQTVRLRGAFGSAGRLDFGTTTLRPGATWLAKASLKVAHPRLWSIGRPQLYRATVSLTDARGRPLGGYVTLSGIRRIAVTPTGRLTLNGHLLNLRGVEVREQDQLTGTALVPSQVRGLVDRVRSLGATLIRADEPGPQLTELADRDGLLIWSEIPVSGLTPNAELADPAWVGHAHAVLGDNIRTNGRHPSILLWSIGDELGVPPSQSEATYIAGAAALARRLDPTRPVGMAVSDWPGLPCQAAYAPLQVIGINEYFGWYDAGGGTTDDRDALSPFLDSRRACYPTQALMVSEFGFDANRSGDVEVRGTYQFQADAAAYHLGVFATKRWLSAAIYFHLEDAADSLSYIGGNPFPDTPFNDKGLFDRYGHPKPAFAVVAASFRATRQISGG